MSTLEVSEDQPYIYRLSYLGVEAQHRGKGPEFAFEVSHLLFGGTKNWHQADHLKNAVAKAGLNLDELEAAIESGEQLKAIEQNQNFLDEAGHWGVPTFVINGEPFFGQDRIETLCWHMNGLGLKKKD
jgi:2-hydroxychromene-2-carboxylate isomerase